MKRIGVHMYKVAAFFIMAFILISSSAPAIALADKGVEAVSRPVKIETLAEEGGFFVLTFQEKIHESLPEFSFGVYALPIRRGSDYQARRIIISETGTKNIVQEISLLNLNKIVDFPSYYDRETMGFVIEDMNFDGYKDIRIAAFMPGGPRIPYFYWLWNEKEGKFVRNEDLEVITAPVFDPVNKMIRSSANISETQSYALVYKYVDSVPMTKEDYLKNLSYLRKMEASLENQKESEKKATVKNCYKGWNEELNNILGHLMREATPQMQVILKAEQKNWLIEREKSAKEAGNMQPNNYSFAYTYSLALSTKNKTLATIDRFFSEDRK